MVAVLAAQHAFSQVAVNGIHEKERAMTDLFPALAKVLPTISAALLTMALSKLNTTNTVRNIISGCNQES